VPRLPLPLLVPEVDPADPVDRDGEVDVRDDPVADLLEPLEPPDPAVEFAATVVSSGTGFAVTTGVGSSVASGTVPTCRSGPRSTRVSGHCHVEAVSEGSLITRSRPVAGRNCVVPPVAFRLWAMTIMAANITTLVRNTAAARMPNPLHCIDRNPMVQLERTRLAQRVRRAWCRTIDTSLPFV
jgi:hypothetical protein